jgi:hypothetical protein
MPAKYPLFVYNDHDCVGPLKRATEDELKQFVAVLCTKTSCSIKSDCSWFCHSLQKTQWNQRPITFSSGKGRTAS